ncbi:MAG: hypothetical protein PHD10_03920 [Bacilli bacterium]|nr:hypothetical protein [Bacilli bacterium]MDD4608257.1 hypothetical protein [Bacilli bacterium]
MKENNIRKKILSAFVMLIITAVALTTATYAWFTENTTVQLAGLDVNVTASNGIQISMDAVTWKASLTLEDIQGTNIQYPTHVNQVPGILVPVSSIGEMVSGKMQMFKGAIEFNGLGNQIVTAQPSVETATNVSGDFIVFDVFVQTSQDETIYLLGTSDVIASTTDKGLKNASRIAFVNIGSVPTGSTPAQAQAITQTGALTPVIWEPNSNFHSPAAISNAAQFGEVITESQVLASYSGVRAAIASGDDILLPDANATNNPTLFGTVTPTIKTVVGNGTTNSLLSLSGAGVHKVRIYAWVEGQDYDCENNASGSNITFNIGLSKTNA